MPCPLCESIDFTSLFRAPDTVNPSVSYDVSQCRRCGLARTDGPSPRYEPAYFGIQRFKRLLPGVGTSRSRAWRKVIPGGRLLDYGCGDGHFVRFARKMGWDARGVDPHAPNAEFQDLAEAISAGWRPHIISLWQSLEHLDNPADTLREMRDVLEPGGAIFLSLPRFDSVQSRWGGPRWFHLDVPRHRFHFSESQLRLLAEKLGGSWKSIERLSMEYDPAGWLQTIANRLLHRPNAFYHFVRGYPRCRGLADWLATAATIGLLWLIIPLSLLLTAVFSGKKSAIIEGFLEFER